MDVKTHDSPRASLELERKRRESDTGNAYTNCDSVELFLNRKSFGIKALEFPRQGNSGAWNRYDRPLINTTTADLHLMWDVPFEAGEIKAIGYNNSGEPVTAVLKTTGEAYALKASAVKDTIGKTNLVQVIINITDKDGNSVFQADNEIAVSLSGGAVLLGLESGSHISHEDYKLDKRKALHGRLVAYVQLPKSARNAEAVISSPGLRSQTIKLY